MARPAGSPKTGGRQKGTPNKATLGLADALERNGLDLVAQLSQTLPKLRTQDRARILMDLMTFIYPKRKAVELGNAQSGPVNLEGLSEQELRSLKAAIEDRLPKISPEERARLLRVYRQSLDETEDESMPSSKGTEFLARP